MADTLSFTILPYEKNINGCIVIFLENLQNPKGKKRMAVKLIWNGLHSRVFPIEYEDEKELLFKLRVEIAKMKWLYWVYGKELAQEILNQ